MPPIVASTPATTKGTTRSPNPASQPSTRPVPSRWVWPGVAGTRIVVIMLPVSGGWEPLDRALRPFGSGTRR